MIVLVFALISLRSIKLLYTEARGGKGAHTEHLCYACWASQDDPFCKSFLASSDNHDLVRGTCDLDIGRARWTGLKSCG